MKESNLAEAIQRPEVHRRLLGNYRGAYALGITSAPGDEQKAALLLRMEGEVPEDVPSTLAVDGEEIPVVVEGGFTAPRPL
jgi:hypothetical protein